MAFFATNIKHPNFALALFHLNTYQSITTSHLRKKIAPLVISENVTV
jgi:hypothetical protein